VRLHTLHDVTSREMVDPLLCPTRPSGLLLFETDKVFLEEGLLIRLFLTPPLFFPHLGIPVLTPPKILHVVRAIGVFHDDCLLLFLLFLLFFLLSLIIIFVIPLPLPSDFLFSVLSLYHRR
jgi:hypothetical protein